MKPEYFQQLYAYHYALYDRIWKSIMQLSDEQFLHDTGYSLGSLRNHMVHMMNVDERWFARIRQHPVPDVLDPAPFTTRALVHEYWDRVRHDVLAFVAGVDEALLQELRHYETRGASAVITSGRSWPTSSTTAPITVPRFCRFCTASARPPSSRT